MQVTLITPCLAFILVFVYTVPSSGMPSSGNPEQQQGPPTVAIPLRNARSTTAERMVRLQREVGARHATDNDTEEYFTILGEGINSIVGEQFLDHIQRRDTGLTFHNDQATFTHDNIVIIPSLGVLWENGTEHPYSNRVFIGNEGNLRRICGRVVTQFNTIQANATGFLPNDPDHMDHFNRFTYCYQYFAYSVSNLINGNRRSGGKGGKGGGGGKGSGGGNGGKGGNGGNAGAWGAAAAAAA